MLTHQGTKVIETSRLLLRKVTLDDAVPMFSNWASDPEVTKFLTWPTHESIDITRLVIDDWLSGYEKDDFYQWMIVLKELGEPIGSISVVHQNLRIESAEIGYCLGCEWWHRGIMSEALLAVMHFLFAEVGFQRLEARHDPNNPHSGGVMKKCGMRFEGIHRRADRNNQGLCDAAVYGILKEELT